MYQRRDVVKGMASLPLAAVLASSTILEAVAAGLDRVETSLPGGKKVKAALALPAAPAKAGSKAGAMMLVHEWWGLNDQIKAVAADFAKQGYLALAIDLYDGKVAKTPGEARKYMQTVKPDEATRTTKAWAAWLAGHETASGKAGVVGWCFGGGWSLASAIASPLDATVVYYGNVARKAAELASLKGPVLGHFATRDNWINKTMVEGFEAETKKAGKAFTNHWYEADHAFANPSSGRYDKADAMLAWQRTTAFLKANLGT